VEEIVGGREGMGSLVIIDMDDILVIKDRLELLWENQIR
jgi:hypothetical protein